MCAGAGLVAAPAHAGERHREVVREGADQRRRGGQLLLQAGQHHRHRQVGLLGLQVAGSLGNLGNLGNLRNLGSLGLIPRLGCDQQNTAGEEDERNLLHVCHVCAGEGEGKQWRETKIVEGDWGGKMTRARRGMIMITRMRGHKTVGQCHQANTTPMSRSGLSWGNLANLFLHLVVMR